MIGPRNCDQVFRRVREGLEKAKTGGEDRQPTLDKCRGKQLRRELTPERGGRPLLRHVLEGRRRALEEGGKRRGKD